MKRHLPTSVAALAFLALSWSLGSGCADDGDGSQLEPTPDAGTDAESDGGQGGARTIRTVETRHPFGNVAATDNLLWDGDFEWTYPFADQYGWLVGSASGYLSYGNPTTVIGAQCLSGIKCAQLDAGGVLVGIGVASKGHALAVSFAARPHAGCAGVAAILLNESSTAGQLPLEPDSTLPDDRGWCRYRALASERDSAQWLYIENQSGETALIDDAVIEPVEPRSVSRGAVKLPPERVAHFERVRHQIRQLLKPGEPPPNRDRLVFEQWVKRARLGRRSQ